MVIPHLYHKQKNMASRRKLKKTIQFVCSELISEIYFRFLLNKNTDEKTVDSLVIRISELAKEYTKRSNRPAGKDNPALVKSYYRSLYTSWNEQLGLIINEIDNI